MCEVTSAWENQGNSEDVCTVKKWVWDIKKHIMGPCGLRSETSYLNASRLRNCDRYAVVIKILGKDMSTVIGRKCWAGWAPKAEEDR